MHLVVLRRNEVELPAVLPSSLMPYVPANSEPFASDLGGEEAGHRSPSPLPATDKQHLVSAWSQSSGAAGKGGTLTNSGNEWTNDTQWTDNNSTAANSEGDWANSKQRQQVIYCLPMKYD